MWIVLAYPSGWFSGAEWEGRKFFWGACAIVRDSYVTEQGGGIIEPVNQSTSLIITLN